MALVLLLYILFASTFTFGKAALTYIEPIMFIGIRMVLAGGLLLGYQYFCNRSQWRYEKKDFWPFFQVAFFLYFISFVAEFWSMKYVSASKACLIFNLSPFVTALFVYWLWSEKLTRKQWIGLCIGMLGFFPIFLNQSRAEMLTSHIWVFSMPELVLMVAVVAASYGWIINKHLVVNRSYSVIMVNGITMFFGGILAILAGLIIENAPWIIAAENPLFGLTPFSYATLAFLGYMVLLILIANVICFNLYSLLLRKYSATFVSFAGFTTPFFAAVFDFLYLKEVVPLSFFITIGIVSIGIYLFYQDELRDNK